MSDYFTEFLEEIKEEKQEMLNKPMRPGDFGYHHTIVGKIVYQRPKHFFTKKDWERIGRKYMVDIIQANEENQPAAPWWMRILKDYTIEMLDDIFDKIPILKALGIEPERIYWEIQEFSTEIGMRWADALQREGRWNEADMIRAAFRPYSFQDAVARK